MIWTLRIKLLRCENEWSVDLEIDSASVLVELHSAIQKAVNFDNDHLYAFYTARAERSRNREFFDDVNTGEKVQRGAGEKNGLKMQRS